MPSGLHDIRGVGEMLRRIVAVVAVVAHRRFDQVSLRRGPYQAGGCRRLGLM